METLRAKTPVFTDESGRRLTVLQWVARGLCACFLLVGAAIAFTLVTHVPLPGLGGILSPPATDSAPGAAREGSAGGKGALDTGLTAGSDPGPVAGWIAGSARESRTRPTAVETAQAAQAGAAASETNASTSGEDAFGSAETPQPQATATASPVSNNPASQSNANPRATAKSANSTVRATPHATTKTKNVNATAGKATGQSSTREDSTPPGRTK